jgi:5-formyltetrahydrofolate cyclo-ligase
MQPTTADQDKAVLRREMLCRRQTLSPQAVAAASAAVTRRVMALPQWPLAREILAYLPTRGEVDTRELAKRILEEGRRLLLPRCREGAPGRLDLACVGCLDEAVPGHFGILEPPAAQCHAPGAFAPDLILVPGVAFDLSGRRLGFGGGYYDRLLALPMAAGAHVVGLGYAFQVVERLPAEAWDRPVDTVITEQATHRFTA